MTTLIEHKSALLKYIDFQSHWQETYSRHIWPGLQNQPCDCKNYHLFLLIIFHTNTSQSLTLMQNLIHDSQKWNTTFRTEDISKNITWCNLHSHGWLLQAHSCMGHPEPLLTMPSIGSLTWFDKIVLLLTKQQINQNFEVLGIINLLNHWIAF